MYNYNSYLRFGGQSGLYYEEPQTSDLSQYSASIWVRTSTKPDDVSRGLSIFSLKPGFQCFFNIRFRVQCNSDSSSSNLQTEGAVRMNNWYVLTLRSKSSQTLIQMRELSNTVFSFSNSGSFFPFGQSKLAYKQVFIGIDSDKKSNGFIGNLRNLKIFSAYYDDATLWKTQFTYLNPYNEMIFQVILSDTNDRLNEPSGNTGQIVGQSSQLTNAVDYGPNIYCYFPSSTDPNLGTTNQALLFDGVACKDNKEKLYMPNDQSYVTSTFKALTDLKGYTIEFWIRPTVVISGDAYLLVLQEPRVGTMYAVITQLSTNQFYCYSSYSQNQTARVKFLDFTSDLRTWQHIGCIIDTNSGFVEGIFFNGQYDFVYYEEINANAFLPKQDYKITLNSDPRYSKNGVSQVHYAELRVWSVARSTQEIKNYQYHQLNLERFRSTLLNYLKLQGGDVIPSPGEIDFANPSLTNVATFKNTQWVQRTDISICPFGTYKGSNTDLNCYREGVSKFQIFIVKNTSHYIVTPFYTIFRNNMIRDDNRQLFNFTWSLTSMNVNNQTNQNLFPSYFDFQKGRKELIFNYNQVSDRPGKYTFDVQMADMVQQMDVQKATITLATYKCLSIFDKERRESVVLMDMDTKRLSEDAVFFYDYTQCGAYVFEQSSITFDIDYSDKIVLLNTDHNKAQKSFTLRAGVQQNLPLNEYFYIRLKGVWRNSQDRTDTIEYYLIYGCRYISKLVPKLKPNYFLVLKGQELVINYDAQYYNMADNSQNRKFTTQWVCPGQLDTYCKSQGEQLRLPYNIFLNSGMDFWTPYTIKVILETNFIQGDGTKYSEGTIKISWSDVNPDAQALLASPLISKEYRLAYQVNILNMNEDQIQIEWTSNPTIPANCQLNTNARKQFVINPTCVSEGVNYNVTCNINYLDQNQVIWQSSNIFRVPVSPRGGQIQCDQTSGKAYLDSFSCSTSGWTLQTATARYQFYITDNNNNLVPISGLINQQTIVTTLPPTKKISVKVVDTNNGIAYANLALTVTYSFDNALVTKVQSLVNTAYASRASTNLQSIIAITQASAVLDSIGNQTIQSTTGRTILDYQRNMTETILQQSLNLKAFTEEQVRRSFILGAISSISSMTENSRFFNAENTNNMMNALYAVINGTYQDSLNNLLYDQSFNSQFFNIFENVYTSLKILLDKKNITNAIMDQQPANNITLSSLTKRAKTILGVYERFVSVRIFENQTFFYNNTVFSFMVTKFSRIAKHQVDQKAIYPNGLYTSYEFPLSDATQPTARQSFAVMNFRISPFIGDWYINQTASSDTSIYFSYRDENGAYLSSENVLRRIKITYKYEYSPFIFLPNVTTCGYIGLGESQWENKSCEVEFSRQQGSITCHCLHMSYYSIIDDYLVRPSKVPLIYLTFRNWSSFIVFLYMILLFVIGTIYTFNKDNQDFRYLHEQEELQGNILSSENSVNMVSLTFKRKIFFMMFADVYKFSNLLKLYLMLLHPIFQLKYRLDPEHPRFYRFLLLFSRLMILFAICFYILKDVQNFDELMGSSLLLVPMPIVFLCCCRSRYFLIDPKGRSRENSDNEMDDEDIVKKSPANKENQRNIISDVMIDTNIPIKLLFLVNAFKLDDIIEHYKGTLSYATGDSNHVGKKLYELDYEMHEAKKVKDSTDESNNKRKSNTDKSKQDKKDNPGEDQTVHTQAFLKNEDQSARINPQDKGNRSQSLKNRNQVQKDSVTTEPYDNQISERKGNGNNQQSNSIRNVDSNRPLSFSPNKSKLRKDKQSADYDYNNKTDMEMLGPNIQDDDDGNLEGSFQKRASKTQASDNKKNRKRNSNSANKINNDYKDNEENMDDDEYNHESGRKKQFYEGGEKEPQKNSNRRSSQKNKNQNDDDMEFDDINNPKNKNQSNKNESLRNDKAKNNNNNEPVDNENEEEAESDLESIDTQLFVDEKKELVEDRDRCLRAFGNSLAFMVNVGLFIAVLASFIAGGYYDKRNQYVWVVVFFGAQIFSFFITDLLVLWLMALCVSGCCRKNKTFLTKWMRESLYIYEDYKYVVQFANTRIT
eukprot:403354642